jgi:hypothetical protein
MSEEQFNPDSPRRTPIATSAALLLAFAALLGAAYLWNELGDVRDAAAEQGQLVDDLTSEMAFVSAAARSSARSDLASRVDKVESDVGQPNRLEGLYSLSERMARLESDVGQLDSLTKRTKDLESRLGNVSIYRDLNSQVEDLRDCVSKLVERSNSLTRDVWSLVLGEQVEIPWGRPGSGSIRC